MKESEDLIDYPKKGLFNYSISISKMRFLVTEKELFPYNSIDVVFM